MTTNPNSLRQSLARARFSQAAIAWQGLTEAVRNAWNAYAAITPRLDSLGQTNFLSGHQQFTGLYATAMNLGLAIPPPVPTSAPPRAALAAVFQVRSVAGVWQMILNGMGLMPANARLIISASPLRSPGVSFEADFFYITNASTLPAANAIFTVPWVAKFGSPAAGRKIFVRTQFFTALGGGGPVTQYSTIAFSI